MYAFIKTPFKVQNTINSRLLGPEDESRTSRRCCESPVPCLPVNLPNHREGSRKEGELWSVPSAHPRAGRQGQSFLHTGSSGPSQPLGEHAHLANSNWGQTLCHPGRNLGARVAHRE